MMRELDLDALLREPIVRMVMERDGLSSGEIRQTFQRVKSARAVRERDTGRMLVEAGIPMPADLEFGTGAMG